MKSPFKNERKLITDFYMWMVENDYDHNIRIRVENKAELFLRESTEANGVEQSKGNCNLQNVSNNEVECLHHNPMPVTGMDNDILYYACSVCGIKM